MCDVFQKWGKELGNPSAQYASGKESAYFLQDLRGQLCDVFNISNRYVVLFTCSSSESNSMVFNSCNLPILCSKFEHPSVKNFPNITAIDIHKNNLDELESYLKKEPHLVSIIAQQHETGLQMPLKEISQLVSKYDSKLHIDASQLKEIDIENLKANYITISSHKIGGPVGVSALISSTLLKPMIYGGAQEENMRAGTQALPLIAGFVAAAQELKQNEFYKPHFQNLKQTLIKNIDAKYFLENHFPNLEFADNIVCMVLEEVPGSEVFAYMDLNDIAIGLGSACKSGTLEGVEAIKYLNEYYSKNLIAQNAFRISFGFENTVEEVEKFAYLFNEFVRKRGC